MKISVFSFAVNDKFPIDIMHRQFIKYMKEDFEFILFNDAMDAQMEQNINTITSFNKIKCVRVPQHIHAIQNPSEGYAASLNWAVHDYAVNNGCEIIILIHSDIFPIYNISITEILGKNIVASTCEFRIKNNSGITYFYPALTIVNMKLLNPMELDFGLEPGLDVGAKTQNFVKNHADSIKFISNYQIDHMIGTLLDNPIVEYYKADLAICRSHGLSAGWIAEGFYHYMAGSQWNSENPIFASGHRQRMDLFLKYFY